MRSGWLFAKLGLPLLALSVACVRDHLVLKRRRRFLHFSVQLQIAFRLILIVPILDWRLKRLEVREIHLSVVVVLSLGILH